MVKEKRMASNEKTYITVLYFQFISPLTSEGEVDFCQKILDGGVYIAPGYEFYSADPGWCRIVFSTPPATLKVGKYCLFIRYFNCLRKTFGYWNKYVFGRRNGDDFI